MLMVLRAAFGQDEVSHGTERYRVGVDRLLFVPSAVALYLVNNAGFHVVECPEAGQEKPPYLSSLLLVRVHHDTAAACSYRGCVYRGDENGYFLVPADAVDLLLAHGFMPVVSEDRSETGSAASSVVVPCGERLESSREGPAAAMDDDAQGQTR
jgi:hypothetical protein